MTTAGDTTQVDLDALATDEHGYTSTPRTTTGSCSTATATHPDLA